MSSDRTLYPFGVKMAALGGLVWTVLFCGTLLHGFRLSIFDLLFLFAPWVVVPLTLKLIPTLGESVISSLTYKAIQYLAVPGAALATASFFFRDGRVAAALTSWWFVVASALAVDGLARLIQTRLRSFQQFCFAFGEGYALVGALWLLASRLGLQPVGFHEPIVLLTAVHFHYAGLMTSVLAGLAASETARTQSALALRLALSCAVLGPGLLGLAFLVGPKLKLAAVAVIAIGECGVALTTFRIGLAGAGKMGGQLLLVGSACVVLGMVLAGTWAIGEYPLHAFVNLEQMARFHGVLNSLGFGFCSLLGWILLRKSAPTRQRI